MSSDKIVLIDGHSLIYRAFFALPPTLATSDGMLTNAAYGFTSMLLKILQEEAPDYVVVAFDRAAPTFRHKKYEEYKAHREAAPEELTMQFPLVRRVLDALGIAQLEKDGYEADDILATLARKAEAAGDEVLIVSGDKDTFQLVTAKTKVLTTRRGITDVVRYDREKVKERFGVPPERIADLLALKGDTSDNIPGVPGIGEKTAAKLLQEHGDLEQLLADVDKIGSARFRELLKEHADKARMSKELAVLDDEVPLAAGYKDQRWQGGDQKEIVRVFTELEFGTLLSRYFRQSEVVVEESAEQLDIEVKTLLDVAGVERLGEKALAKGEAALGLVVEGESIDVELKLLAVAVDNVVYLIEPAGMMVDEGVLKRSLSSFLADTGIVKTVFNSKVAYLMAAREGLEIRGPVFDPLLAAYLLDPSKGKYGPKMIAEDATRLKLTGAGSKRLPEEAAAMLRAKEPLQRALDENGLRRVFEEIEQPLVPVLARMEEEGVGIDVRPLESLSKELEVKLSNLEAEIYRLSGEEFNINSPQQVGTILFEKLGLAAAKKTKTGYSTDYSVLVRLAGQHPVIEKILAFRELSKLKSTYVDALPKMIHARTGRLHTSFNQTVTATGRLSSSNPNLQNIPVRSEYGSRIREAFVPKTEGEWLLVADYSQIELRLLAHLAEDPTLLEAFQKGADIHTEVAAEIFGGVKDDVTAEQRRAAKAVNFGIIYGISAGGLAEQLHTSRDEAADYIDRYFGRYRQVKDYIESVISTAYRDGFVSTIFGRRRRLPELRSGNRGQRSFGERMAVNSGLQGSAADIIKLAMIRAHEVVLGEGLESRMVLQVHDELIFEVPDEERGAMEEIVREAMEGVLEIKVPLRVEMSCGRNWREAK